MKIIPCEENKAFRQKIDRFAETLREESYRLGDHGLSEREFLDSGLFRGAIERLRGQFSASMAEKRDFASCILDFMRSKNAIKNWKSAGSDNRYDYEVTLNSGKIAAIELKGCLDGNNTTIFERPPQAQEFVIWSICTNPGADPRLNAWSGIHTRLGPEIIHRQQRVDGVIIWDMVCGTVGRPCPKLLANPDRAAKIGPYNLPPPCIYLFPATIPSSRNNPSPPAQDLADVHFLRAFVECFGGNNDEHYKVTFTVSQKNADIVRSTTVARDGEIVGESKTVAIKRS